MKQFIILLLVCFSFLMNAQENKTISEIITSNYSIEYPSSWSKDESGIAGSSFFLFAQLTNETDQFKENINLVIQDLSAYDFSLEDYALLSENQVKTLITDSKIIESKQHQNNKRTFHKIVYTGKQGIYDLKFKQYYWLVNKKAYILTFTSEESQFLVFKKEGEFILNSFRIH